MIATHVKEVTEKVLHENFLINLVVKIASHSKNFFSLQLTYNDTHDDCKPVYETQESVNADFVVKIYSRQCDHSFTSLFKAL